MKENVKITIEYELTAERICDMFVGAFEGGSNYWLMSVEQTAGEEPEDKSLVWWGSPNIYKEGLELTLVDEEMDSYKVTWGTIKKGLQKFAKETPRHFNDMIKERDDAITADCFLQYVTLGDIVYG